MRKKITGLLFLMLCCAGLARGQQVPAQTGAHTISVSNTAVNIVTGAECARIQCLAVVVKENSASPSAVFSVTPAGTTTAINIAAGGSFEFDASTSRPYPASVTLGTIAATTSGPFTFSIVESPARAANANTGGSGGGSGTGTVNSGTQYAFAEYSTTGTAVSSGPTPPSSNGTYECGYTVTGAAAVAPTCPQVGLVARTETASTDSILYSDNAEPIEYQGSVAVAVTLPTPTTLGNAHFFTVLNNLTTGTATALTVTPTTWTINGGSTFVIPKGFGCNLVVNPGVSTDWLTFCGPNITKTIWQDCNGKGLGDGYNAIPAQTYPQTTCVNDTGRTITITAIHGWVDNAASTSTLDVQNNAGTSFLMSAPLTCNNTKASGGASGTLGSTVTLAAGDSINFIFIPDGTSKQTNWTVTGYF